MDSRREFLKKAALLTGAAGLSNVIPMSVQKAMAIQADPGSTFYDAEHIVFLMQENRSFDHLFGKLSGVRGFNDPRPFKLPNKNKVWLQNDSKGKTLAPFHVDINKTKITWQGGLPHSWKDQLAARNNGKYDKWVPVKSDMCLGYYKREDIPFYYALADAFTICDHNFCSSLTGTTPNRLFFWTGTIRPEQNGTSTAVVNNSQAESQTNTFVDWHTFPELLEDNGISWKVYQNELWTAKLQGEDIDDWLGNYGDNPLEYIKRHQVKLSAYFRKNGDHTSVPKLTAAEVTERYNKLSQREKNLIDKAFCTNIDAPDGDYLKLEPFNFTDENGKEQTVRIPKGDIFYQFRKDVDNGTLPTVSWLVAPQKFSDHTSSPLYGTWYVSEALNILTKNPEVFKKTIFILTYDENDGYFDHIPPFVVPDPDNPDSGKVSERIKTAVDFENKAKSPIGLGYRVPMIIASPWSKGGYVNSQVFDHTSSLMFLEKFLSKKTGKTIKSPNISSWRRAICGDLSSVFRPYNQEYFPAASPLKREKVITAIQHAKNKPAQVAPTPLLKEDIEKINSHLAFSSLSSSFMPKQESGTRPACSLPYQLYADCELNEDKTGVQLYFKSDKTAFGAKTEFFGAAFNVSLHNFENSENFKALAYAVAVGDQVKDQIGLNQFRNETYDLSVYGPNGFYRQFKGNKNDPGLKTVCLYERTGLLNKKQSGNLLLKLENKGSQTLTVHITDPTYSNPVPKPVDLLPNSKISIIINLEKSSGWYDLQIKTAQNPDFSLHYAGHVETESDSITDPHMGESLKN